MRKSSIVIFLLIVCINAFGKLAPMGMKYQAVAKDLSGIVMADKQVTLQITLAGNVNNSRTNYIEKHNVTTSKPGLFNLVLGEGKKGEGAFTDVPGSSQDIWMKVSLKTNAGFAAISNSRLLVVPYALHALTASELVNPLGWEPGVPSNTWSTFLPPPKRNKFSNTAFSL